jgi:hypothetical protein
MIPIPDHWLTVERLVVITIATGIVSWVAAKWRSAKKIEDQVGPGLRDVVAQIGALQRDIDARFAAMNAATESQRAQVTAQITAQTAQAETRFQRIEQVLWDTDQRGGLRHLIGQLVERGEHDREVLRALDSRTLALVESLSGVKDLVQRANLMTRDARGDT